MYEIWYVWKRSKFVKFFAYIDKLEIYNPEKINAVKSILDTEKTNLTDNLRAVIITDFFDDVDWLLDCKMILKELSEYSELNPILVSGQWFFMNSPSWEAVKIEGNILDITKDFNDWKYQLLIWTRGFLWEWWDSPKVNTLIDVTWVSSFMSTNQVRWRAIRLDKSNLKKVANIYDIVTVDTQKVLHKDLDRLDKKHNQTYWVSDSGLVIKWVAHIFPNLLENVSNFWEINTQMLQRSAQRDYFYSLWKVWWEFKNKEQFIMQLHINPLFKYFPQWWSVFAKLYTYFFRYRDIRLNNIWEITYYDTILKNYIAKILTASETCLKANGIIGENFSYNILIEWSWNYKIIWKDDLNEFDIKKFMEISHKIFSPILDQKYIFYDEMKFLDAWKFTTKQYYFPLPKQLCNNKNQRKKWYYYFITWKWFEKNHKITKFYNSYMSHRFKYIEKDKTHFLGYSSFIHSEIEKIWI